ncbi:hypothetical protein [Tengunoibacter tsumagoiensis]|uniref:Uncharacterized protein n=1 Tax=Tengunoibacter tsumagoiensis TaxID=2014871 RepID=A0A402A7G6_9CHLR|nr:hypothetical protein [Tengunoibacter tsumagoiensis]GCE14961.1 hypothetical protein KTT_48200 [Tengunoibacter tsumagoiensis]
MKRRLSILLFTLVALTLCFCLIKEEVFFVTHANAAIFVVAPGVSSDEGPWPL